MTNYTSFTEALEKLINSPEGTIMECEDKSHLELTIKDGTLYSFDLEDKGIESKANPILTISRMNKKWRIKPVEFYFNKAIEYLEQNKNVAYVNEKMETFLIKSVWYKNWRIDNLFDEDDLTFQNLINGKFIIAEDQNDN